MAFRARFRWEGCPRSVGRSARSFSVPERVEDHVHSGIQIDGTVRHCPASYLT